MQHSFIPRIKRCLKIRKFINVTHHLTIQSRKTVRFFTFGAENILIKLNIYLFLKQEQKKSSNKEYPGTSLAVQWLRLHTSNAGEQVQSLVVEQYPSMQCGQQKLKKKKDSLIKPGCEQCNVRSGPFKVNEMRCSPPLPLLILPQRPYLEQ